MTRESPALAAGWARTADEERAPHATWKADIIAGVQVDDEAILLEDGEDDLKVPPVHRLVRAGYQDVVQIDKSEGQTAENRVHEPLEGHSLVA